MTRIAGQVEAPVVAQDLVVPRTLALAVVAGGILTTVIAAAAAVGRVGLQIVAAIRTFGGVLVALADARFTVARVAAIDVAVSAVVDVAGQIETPVARTRHIRRGAFAGTVLAGSIFTGLIAGAAVGFVAVEVDAQAIAGLAAGRAAAPVAHLDLAHVGVLVGARWGVVIAARQWQQGQAKNGKDELAN
jgi:hypothetical protein